MAQDQRPQQLHSSTPKTKQKSSPALASTTLPRKNNSLSGTALRKILTEREELLTALTPEEESQIIQAKQLTIALIEKIRQEREWYRLAFEEDQPSGMQTQFLIRDASGTVRPATQVEAKNVCDSTRKKAAEYIDFLFGRAEALAAARQYDRSILEYKTALEFSVIVQGANHPETLRLELDYHLAMHFSQMDKNPSKIDHLVIMTVEKTLEKLEKSLRFYPALKDQIEKSIAMGLFQTAQYYSFRGKPSKAIKDLDKSEKLRKVRGISEFEIDKIRFLRSMIAFQKGDKKQAISFALECYGFRRAENELNSHLIPVLEHLIEMMEQGGSVAWKKTYLMHLLRLQKHLGYNEREIISTQSKIVALLGTEVSYAECRPIMDDLEQRLHDIPVTEENANIGASYIDLANAFMRNVPPPDPSSDERRNVYAKVLRLFTKAELHFRSDRQNRRQNVLNWLRDKKRECASAIEACEQASRLPAPTGTSPQRHASTASQPSTREQLMILSDFSSEVDHSIVSEQDRLLTLEEFERLPDKGAINPYKLRVAQEGISSTFGDGRSLEDMEQELVANPDYTNQVPAIEIGAHKGKIYSFDTRRLIVHQKAKKQNPAITVKYVKITGQHLEERIRKIFSPRPWEGNVTAIRHGGKDSASQPHINPALEAQLAEKVTEEFKSYPKERSSGDVGGFPVTKKKAQKINAFLKNKAAEGSDFAQRVLVEAQRIGQSEGRQAAYNFLIQKKAELQKQSANTSLVGAQNGAPHAKLTELSPPGRVTPKESRALHAASSAPIPATAAQQMLPLAFSSRFMTAPRPKPTEGDSPTFMEEAQTAFAAFHLQDSEDEDGDNNLPDAKTSGFHARQPTSRLSPTSFDSRKPVSTSFFDQLEPSATAGPPMSPIASASRLMGNSRQTVADEKAQAFIKKTKGHLEKLKAKSFADFTAYENQINKYARLKRKLTEEEWETLWGIHDELQDLLSSTQQKVRASG